MVEYSKSDLKKEIDSFIGYDWPTADSLGAINGIKNYLAEHISASKNTLSRMVKTFDLQKATGSRLDEIGYMLGVPRIQYNTASIISNNIEIKTVDGRTFGSHFLSDVVLSSGVRLYNPDKNVGAFTVADKILPMDQSSVFVNVSLETTNLSGYIPAGFFSQVDYTSARRTHRFDTSKLIITNTSPIQLLPENESDDRYRYRLDLRRRSWKTDTIGRVKNILEKFPISTYSIIRNKHSFGTLIVIVVPQTIGSNTALITSLEQAVELEFPMVYGFIKFREPLYVNVDLSVNINFQPGSTTQPTDATLKSQISNYINNLDVGSELDINKLNADISSLHSSIESATITTLLLNGEVIDLTQYTTIPGEWYEKFISIDRTYNEGSTTVQKVAVQII